MFMMAVAATMPLRTVNTAHATASPIACADKQFSRCITKAAKNLSADRSRPLIKYRIVMK